MNDSEKRKLEPGDKAPDFSAMDHQGNLITLSGFAGKKLILYFYPKDNTPGCTSEACGLRDNYALLKDKGFDIVGVSADDARSHKNFSEKFGLPFPLIPDSGKEILRSYGAWGPKKLYGREYEGILRKTFVIDEKGKIMHIILKVDTKDPAGQILKLLK